MFTHQVQIYVYTVWFLGTMFVYLFICINDNKYIFAIDIS